ncbi:MAG: S-methyl-5'-thioadenosine phosphorylase [Spirochaetales bacterium]|nr:S-methyl-5'-thioadenosine phosphorylase [Spirochaetales bacterium]
MSVPIGIIGGSGVYHMANTKVLREIDVPTPFGMPSDIISILDINGQEVAFLPRHGKGHRLLPTELPSQANIWALKSLGVKKILSFGAVGSLVEDYKPGDFVVCDQIIDRTRSRCNSYFGDGVVGHVGFAEPFCSSLRDALIKALSKGSKKVHPRGTIVAMEGPLFSSRAESELYRFWKAHLVGMTTLPEAKLAREAEMCYSLVAMVTDYDCWRDDEEGVSTDMVLKVMKENSEAVQNALGPIVSAVSLIGACSCESAAQLAIMTAPELIPYETKRKLRLFYDKYWTHVSGN